MKKSYILQAFTEGTWAILPNKLTVLHGIVMRHVAGEDVEPDEVEMSLHGAARPQERQISSLDASGTEISRTVAVLPLFGTIFPRANLMTSMSGATSAEAFGAAFQELVDDPEIDAIVMDVNSPGGYVPGVEELSNQIYQARGSKPIVAVSNHLMASAAFWIASAADEIVVTPSSEVGSVGVFAVHQDISKALEQDGVKVTLISAGKYKVEGNSYEPLGEEARASIQASVDETYDVFVEALARNRNVSVETVKNDFGEGRVVGSRQAVEAGMADRIGTLQETVRQYLTLETPQVSPPDGPTSSIEPAPVETASPAGGELEAQAQRLRERVSNILQNKEKL